MNALESYIKSQLESYNFLHNPKSVVPYLPENIYIEPTNYCNLNCRICVRKKLVRQKGFLNIQNFKIIIDKLIENDWIVPLTLCGNGEPLINKDIFSMIEYAKSRDFNVTLLSNSTLLTDERIEKLVASGLDKFQTGFDSLDKDSYELVRRGANFEKTKLRLIKLINKNDELHHPIYIGIISVRTSLTKKIDETKKFWLSFPIDNFWSSQLYTMHADSEMYDDAWKYIELDSASKCAVPFQSFNIGWNGDTVLCATDVNYRWITGNIFKDSLEYIWNGDRAQALRKAILENDIDFFKRNNHRCDKCNVPYIKELTIEGWIENMPYRMSKKVRTYHE